MKNRLAAFITKHSISTDTRWFQRERWTTRAIHEFQESIQQHFLKFFSMFQIPCLL